jgi:hypothetical protein
VEEAELLRSEFRDCLVHVGMFWREWRMLSTNFRLRQLRL